MEKMRKYKGCASMPRRESQIAENPMKLYSYLVCLGKMATYPEYAKLFRQRELSFTKIKQATGITNDTVKLYLFLLEYSHLIRYKGEYKFDFCKVNESLSNGQKAFRAAAMEEAKRTWKLRTQEKSAAYIIPRPDIWTPIPEATLNTLNEDFEVSELELKIYLIFCSYRDLYVEKGYDYFNIGLEEIREILGLSLHSITDGKIRYALYFYKGLGLLEFNEEFISNERGAKISRFRITEVHYYINNRVEVIDKIKNNLSEDEKELIKSRIEKIF